MIKQRVLCLLNGIGHEDTIEKYVATDKIFLGNTLWTADLIGPGQVRLFGEGSVELQNIGEGKEAAAKELAEVLTASGLNASYSENIRYSIYRKACVNGTLNGFMFNFGCQHCTVWKYSHCTTNGANHCWRIRSCCGS